MIEELNWFAGIKDKLAQKLSEQEARIVSHDERVILIKSNATIIPQYSLKWFILPQYMCKEIENTNRNFFLNKHKNRRKSLIA